MSRIFYVVMLVGISIGCSINTVNNGFVYDDVSQVLGNRWITDVGHIPDIFLKGSWSFEQGNIDVPQNYYRPFLHLVYMAEYHIFGLNPWGWHLTNVIFHAGVTVMVFLVATELLTPHSPLPTPNSQSFLNPAFIAALLFAAHPIHTEVVAWVGAVPELGFTLFYLLAFYYHIKESSFLPVIFFLIATLFKETALTLPLLLFAYDYLIPSHSLSPLPLWERGRVRGRGRAYLSYLITIIIYLALRTYALGGVAPLRGDVNLDIYEQFINIFPLFAQYLKKLILPVNLNAYYVFHPIHSVLEWKSIFGIAVTGAFILSIPLLKRISRPASINLLLIVIPLLPVFYIRGISSVAFAERYLYLPSTGFAVFVSFWLAKAGEKHLTDKKTVLWKTSIIVIALTASYAVMTIKRNAVWRDEYSLWLDTVKKSPEAATPHYNLGMAFMNKGELAAAEREYQTAIRVKPDHIKARNNLGGLYLEQGRLTEAIIEFMEAVRLKPDNTESHYNLGLAYIRSGQPDEAKREFEAVLKLNHNDVEAAKALEFLNSSSYRR